LPDDALIFYAQGKRATLITTNGNCARLAQRLRAARVIYLKTVEVHALDAMDRAFDWLDHNRLPEGRVLQVPRRGEIKVLAPKT
jgi:hypothetical protein